VTIGRDGNYELSSGRLDSLQKAMAPSSPIYALRRSKPIQISPIVPTPCELFPRTVHGKGERKDPEHFRPPFRA
jgi:hypothetical protein